MVAMTVPTGVTGIVLAAGAGTRMGGPKALLRRPDGEPWVARACSLLLAAGCDRVVVVLGAGAGAARALVPVGSSITTVVADRWDEGISWSLRAGLGCATGDAVLVTLVDLPDQPVEVARRVLAPTIEADSLRQAVFGGRPGHPVLIGREHWGTLVGELEGDVGARAYLVEHGVEEVECGDLSSGLDVDRPPTG